uniref:Uncharacterized protein n=2 Tax=viral metagenome TaxID=1070528 RepID=A0A6M3K8U1_9ZZZZ
MRSRKQIENDGTKVDTLSLEVLLDIRDLMVKQAKKEKKNKNNTPRVCDRRIN